MVKEANNTNIDSKRSWLFWLVLGLAFFLFIFLIRGVLLPFVLGTFIAYFLDPAADKLEEWKFSRGVATAIITLLFFTILVLVLLLVIPTVASQLSGLVADLPVYFMEMEKHYEKQFLRWMGKLPPSYAESIKEAASNFSGTALKVLGDMAGGIFHSGMAIINVLSLILITPVVAFYLLRDWDIIKLRFYALLPRKQEGVIREQLALIDNTIAGFVRGQMNVCLLLGLFYAVGLSLVGLKFGFLIGFITGILIILPYVGQMFGTLVGLGVAFFQFEDWQGMLPVLAVFIAGQVLEGSLITPKLVGKKVGLHPVWIIFGMLAGAALFGFLGVLIAVPVSAVIGVLIRFATAHYLNSKYYHGA